MGWRSLQRLAAGQVIGRWRSASMRRSVSRLEITGLAAGQSVGGDQQVFRDVGEHDGDQRVCRDQ